MSRDDPHSKVARPRANTASFPPFAAWRRTRAETTVAPQLPVAAPPVLSLDALIQALSPPAVPSLAHARALASTLTSQSPLPRRAVLNPVLASLCDAKSPVAVQAAGYDVLSAYCENNEAPALATADRLSYFSLFLGSTHSPWVQDLWEPRFKALRALTKYGVDVVGIELDFLNVLKSWIAGGFEGLLRTDTVMDRGERAERERSIDILAKFLASVLSNPETMARISEEDLAGILDFYAALVDRSVLLLNKPPTPTERPAPFIGTPTKSSVHSHRRNQSSTSASSVTSSSPLASLAPYAKHPADIAISLYLDHLSSQLKTLSPSYLETILPLLLRALACCASPLPRLSVHPHPARKPTSEDMITETLNALFSGPYSTTCMLILKRYLFPPPPPPASPPSRHPVDIARRRSAIYVALHTSRGAHRTFRNYVRRALATRLARAYISRESSVGYSPSGAPGHMNLERDLMERAWPKEDYTTSALGLGRNGWDAGRLGKVLTNAVGEWVRWVCEEDVDIEKVREGREDILEEAAGVLKDIWQELDVRGEDEKVGLDEEEAYVIGETLEKLVEYVIPLKNRDGTPYILPLSSPSAPTPFLRSLSSLLSRDHAMPTSPLLSTILIHIADNLTDADTAELPRVMSEQHDLSPTSPQWLENWREVLGNRSLVSARRPLTRRAVMEALVAVYEAVRDMKSYRTPLADMVCDFCARPLEEGSDRDAGDVAWRILGDEVVLRTVERTELGKMQEQEDDGVVGRYIDLLVAAASEEEHEYDDDAGDTMSIRTTDTHSPSPPIPTPASIPSPKTEQATPVKESKDSGLMSIISSLTTGHSSRSQSIQPPMATEDVPDDPVIPLAPSPSDIPVIPRVVTAVSALIAAFSQLAFTPYALEPSNTAVAIRVYHTLLDIINDGKSTRARLTALQFLMRIRADRDHRLYFTSETPSHVTMLSTLINRVWAGPSTPEAPPPETPGDSASNLLKTRPQAQRERDGRQLSRGVSNRGPSRATTSSRSRSRATATLPRGPMSKPFLPLWNVPETFPFVAADVSLSEKLMSYDPEAPDQRFVLPISLYLDTMISILEKETNWDVLSYVLCHLPVQLANKHLFCGPKARESISRMLSVICAGILNGEMAAHLEDPSIKPRDAQGLAYHTLSVLVSYRRCFDLKQCHLLVEVFQTGLSMGQFTTIKCCLHALSLCAFELQSSVTKCLPRILEMLSQIMSGANMAVHILGFLFLIGSLPPLYANFTENDYKMVFGVALQYLQHYNRMDPSSTQSWALSQHVRILSYTVVYVWFLALKLPDRPRHIPYITRQLLLANEGNEQIDDPTEVCFDWLARYTYASADPRPAPSVFNDILMNPPSEHAAVSEKTWILGHSVITIRSLAKRGWIEVLCRRPSGLTKFLCHTENAPLVGSGDVNPDLFSVPALLMMERNPSNPVSIETEPHVSDEAEVRNVFVEPDEDSLNTPRPDPVTGYVWSGTAPSQRRKDVTVDPSFFSLQLSAYPERTNPSYVRTITDSSVVSRFVTTLDRIPVIDTHKVGIMYVAPGQTEEAEILRNTHGSPAYTRFLEGLGRLVNLRGQRDVYAGGLEPDEDGEYAYAWWDDIGQVLYHAATMMPTSEDDPQCNNKKRHIGNDYVRIVWNDSGHPYRFDTLATQFQFVNIVIEPHSLGAIAAFSNNIHENEYFKVTVQRAPGMTEFAPVGHFKLISAESLPLFVRQLSQLADWFASVFSHTKHDTVRLEMKTNWRTRLESIRRFKNQFPAAAIPPDLGQDVMSLEAVRDFTTTY
ncbi:hypothetical protein H0H81_000188 [Sphagnurus paluster]|uniref:Rap-GAP domain-containing protein n=1 Tax=Sphagnurus paluster TaxID=117069 RepID=A0A9P7K4X9_9AGAR|nr:hypothetical protein H0H81_000188 [Sphagnurus paluster]